MPVNNTAALQLSIMLKELRYASDLEAEYGNILRLMFELYDKDDISYEYLVFCYEVAYEEYFIAKLFKVREKYRK